ncbi:MAG: ferritin-like domain-containing protein [Acidimicrobiales bacterium]|nr:ferritin-like domain-containing protein [Acidimicrobiales bacterium]
MAGNEPVQKLSQNYVEVGEGGGSSHTVDESEETSRSTTSPRLLPPAALATASQSGSIEELARTVSGPDKAALIRDVSTSFDSLFTWDYEKGRREQLNHLYEKAKVSQWNAETDIDWSISGQIDSARDPDNPLNQLGSSQEGPFASLTPAERATIGHAGMAWTLSQFMHGEQGALLCTAKIVDSVPWIDAKYYAATQVMDEARHVEVYAKYLRDKLEWEFPVNVHLRDLLDTVLSDPRWDFTYLGMQIMVEGLALAAFGFQYQFSPDPLLKQITRYVMADEARHVAFGVISLKEAYRDLSAAEVRERQEFCYEAAIRMRDRFLQQEVWETLGMPVKECCEVLLHNPLQLEFRRLLFSKIVPNLKKLGLLDAGDGWLRQRFGELGVLEFEAWEDTGAEYERMQLEAPL